MKISVFGKLPLMKTISISKEAFRGVQYNVMTSSMLAMLLVRRFNILVFTIVLVFVTTMPSAQETQHASNVIS